MSESSYKGFWSYVHKDDEDEGGRISRLAKDLVAQYEMCTGDRIKLFLDKDRNKWGEDWRDNIDGSLASVAFFIPVLTPKYFKSPECRKELHLFARRANKLGLKELLLPLLYVDVPSLSDESVEDDLLRLLRQFQRKDWRELRFTEVTSEAYRRGVHEMAIRLVEANKHLEEANVDEAAPELDGATGEEEDATPGIIDRLAKSEEGGSQFKDTLLEITKQIEIIGEVMEGATSDINKAGGGRGVFARRVQITRGVAMKLAGPTEKITMLTNQYDSQLHTIDDGIRIIIELAPAEITENPDVTENYCIFFNSIRTLSEAAHKALNSVQGMIESAAPLEQLSRDLRPVVRRMRQALTIMVESREASDNWIGLMENSGVDCR